MIPEEEGKLGDTGGWSHLSAETVVSQFHSHADQGLNQVEVDRRLAEYGPNELQAAPRLSPWSILFEQFKNILILILIIAVVVSAFFGHSVEAIAVTIIVLFAVFLGFVQEYRAERAIEALKKMAAPTAAVLRNGEEINLPARHLVPGDIILIRAGDRIPADARLIEAVNLKLEEAALTGESISVEKHTAPIPESGLALGDRRNMIYAGTAATYGRGRGVVVATGMQTEFGKIARLLQTVETGKTPLQENLDKVGRVLARAAILIVILIVALGLLRGQPLLSMVIFGVALAVAVVPEALPAVVTISLAIAVQRMIKRNVLIRRLPAVETLGSISVICSDKTGTLTKDEMTVRKIYVAGQTFEVSGAGYNPHGEFSRNGSTVEPPAPLLELLQAGILASDVEMVQNGGSGQWHIKGDPTEKALVVAAAKAGLFKTVLGRKYPRVYEIPFTSETKRMTTLHETPVGGVAYSKGAPEVILDSCHGQTSEAGEIPLKDGDKDALLAKAREMAGEALRILAVARKSNASPENAEQGMTFMGFLGMLDPTRPEAKAAVLTCEAAGIKVVMITGDHPLTAQAIARDLGLLKMGRVITGANLEAMNEAEFEREVEHLEVYARVSPAHKLRVVTALQKKGHFVAMTGDGVNDAPALKKADIGIAMGITGTDVTKEAAAMTLTDDNFASIVAAVEEGRGVFGNIKKYLMFLLSCNIGEIFLMMGAMLFGLPLPLSAVQILYINLATDGLPALALAVDPFEQDLMRRKPRNPRTGIFSRPVVVLMMAGGLWSAAVNLGLFAWILHTGRSHVEAMTMTFVTLIFIEFFKAYSFRSEGRSVLNRPLANRWLNLAILWEFFLLVFILYVPFLNTVFGTFGLTFRDWGLIVVLASTILPVLELVKYMERHGIFSKRVEPE